MRTERASPVDGITTHPERRLEYVPEGWTSTILVCQMVLAFEAEDGRVGQWFMKAIAEPSRPPSSGFRGYLGPPRSILGQVVVQNESPIYGHNKRLSPGPRTDMKRGLAAPAGPSDQTQNNLEVGERGCMSSMSFIAIEKVSRRNVLLCSMWKHT